MESFFNDRIMSLTNHEDISFLIVSPFIYFYFIHFLDMGKSTPFRAQ